MPYVYYTRMSPADALAIRTYLNTVQPVHSEVVSNQLPFPFNIRASLVFWNALYFEEGVFRAASGKSAEWNRGAYLVEGPAHCGMCHTPKTRLGVDDSRHRLQGYTLQGWFAPNITNEARRGLGRWSVDDIVTYLRTRHNPFAAGAGPMAEEIARSSSRMGENDLKAIAIYLKDQTGQGSETAPPIDPKDPFVTAGAAIYADECAACHKMDGSGVPALIPALRGSAAAQSADPTSLLRVVLRGGQSVATDRAPTGPAMPAYAWQLGDDQVAAVITYVRNAWGNVAPTVRPGDVKSARAQLMERND
jgi:mono/diheme cytochrome c family protein